MQQSERNQLIIKEVNSKLPGGSPGFTSTPIRREVNQMEKEYKTAIALAIIIAALHMAGII